MEKKVDRSRKGRGEGKGKERLVVRSERSECIKRNVRGLGGNRQGRAFSVLVQHRTRTARHNKRDGRYIVVLRINSSRKYCNATKYFV